MLRLGLGLRNTDRGIGDLDLASGVSSGSVLTRTADTALRRTRASSRSLRRPRSGSAGSGLRRCGSRRSSLSSLENFARDSAADLTAVVFALGLCRITGIVRP